MIFYNYKEMQTRSQTNSFKPQLLHAEVDDKYCKKQKMHKEIFDENKNNF